MPQLQQLASQVEFSLNAFIKTGVAPIGADKFTLRPAPTAKSAAGVVMHLAQSNEFLAGFLAGKPAPNHPADKASFNNVAQDEALKQLQVSNAMFLSALKALKAEDLIKPAKLPWRETDLAGVIQDTLWHITYHLGQLTYIQTFLGDVENHF